MKRKPSLMTPERRERTNVLRLKISELVKDHAEATAHYEQARVRREGTSLALKDARAQLQQVMFTPEQLAERRAQLDRDRPKMTQARREAANALVPIDPSQPIAFVPSEALEPEPFFASGPLLPNTEPGRLTASSKPERSTDQLTCTQCGGTITPRGLCKCPGVRHRAARKIEPGPRVTLRHDAVKPYDMSQHRE